MYWTNEACFWEGLLPLGSLGSEKFITSESSFISVVFFKILTCVNTNLLHAIAQKVTVTTGSFLKFI
jgi:hypothetical protein